MVTGCKLHWVDTIIKDDGICLVHASIHEKKAVTASEF